MILLDNAHARPLDLAGDIKTLGTKANISAATIPESAFDIAGVNAGGKIGVEGVLFQMLSLDSLRTLKNAGQAGGLIYAPVAKNRRVSPGQKKALRVYIGGAGGHADTAFTFHTADGAMIRYGDTLDWFGWQWVRFDYLANGYIYIYTSQGEYERQVPGSQPVYLQVASRIAGSIFTLDVGRDGSACLAGYEWV